MSHFSTTILRESFRCLAIITSFSFPLGGKPRSSEQECNLEKQPKMRFGQVRAENHWDLAWIIGHCIGAGETDFIPLCDRFKTDGGSQRNHRFSLEKIFWRFGRLWRRVHTCTHGQCNGGRSIKPRSHSTVRIGVTNIYYCRNAWHRENHPAGVWHITGFGLDQNSTWGWNALCRQ